MDMMNIDNYRHLKSREKASVLFIKPTMFLVVVFLKVFLN